MILIVISILITLCDQSLILALLSGILSLRLDRQRITSSAYRDILRSCSPDWMPGRRVCALMATAKGSLAKMNSIGEGTTVGG